MAFGLEGFDGPFSIGPRIQRVEVLGKRDAFALSFLIESKRAEKRGELVLCIIARRVEEKGTVRGVAWKEQGLMEANGEKRRQREI